MLLNLKSVVPKARALASCPSGRFPIPPSCYKMKICFVFGYLFTVLASCYAAHNDVLTAGKCGPNLLLFLWSGTGVGVHCVTFIKLQS
ncbi:hypothetical protein CEXT_471381 [Caerostris extrusa]|uniref:Uncharacterized protein n=1 Tax=Caerostris extrusa TaxID=172846 RepID=A0AAV4U2F9_CAEEX|nr:hypothetical protein CEXT_471381 [Caerostris extrusa]